MAFRSASGLAGGNGASAAVPVPSGAASGDIAVVGVYKENTAAVTPPAGFTQKAALTTSGTSRGTLYVFWKRLTGADSGTYSFSWSGSTFKAGACALFSGRTGSGDPFDGTVGTAESTTSVATLNVSTSPANANGDAVGFWTNFTGGNAYTAPTNYTERQDLDVITLDTRDAVASGSTGSISATSNVSGFQKAFLGVLAAAGGTDATPTPAATTTVVSAPQATPSVADAGTPSAITNVVALPTATPAGSGTATPAAAPIIVSTPQATPTVADTTTPAVLSTVASLPQATPTTAGNATASPAAIAVIAAMPQAAPSGHANRTPAVTIAAATFPAATPRGAATASPLAVAAVAALPAPNIQAGGNTTAAPAATSVVAALPQAAKVASSTVTPVPVVTTALLPAAGAGVDRRPTTFPVVALLPTATKHISAGPSPTSAVASLPATAERITAGAPLLTLAVDLPHAAGIDEGAQVKGFSDPEVTGSVSEADVTTKTSTAAVIHRYSSGPTVSDG